MNEKMLKKHKESILERKGTLAIILVNLIAFMALNMIPNMGDNLLLSPDINMIIEKPWTLITVFFSHKIHFHMLLNMALLLIFGSRLEKITSTKMLFFFYLIAGFIGSLVIIPVASLIGNEDLMAGASAAVFAIVIMYAVLRPDAILLKSKAKWWALSLFIFNLIIAFINPETSDGAAAHVAGIIVGLICGYWLKNKESKETR